MTTTTIPAPIRGFQNMSVDRAFEHRFEQAFVAYLRYGHESAHHNWLVNVNNELRDQSAGTNTAGGFLVPPGFLNKLTVGIKRGSAMARACNVITTDSGGPLTWPTTDDTGNIGAILGENNPVPVQDVTFGGKTLGSFLYTSREVKASLQLIEDTGIDFESWLAVLLGRRIGRAVNAHLTNGTGGGTQPTGLVPSTAVGTSCVASYSTVRALYSSYGGTLYQVTRASNGQALDVGLLAAGGYANAAAQNNFCAGTVCTITKLYDQSPNHNDLTIAPVGAAGSSDVGARADALPVAVAGHKARRHSRDSQGWLSPIGRHGDGGQRPARVEVRRSQWHLRDERVLLRLRQRRDDVHRHRQGAHGRHHHLHLLRRPSVQRRRALGVRRVAVLPRAKGV